MKQALWTALVVVTAVASTAIAQETMVGDWILVPRLDLITDENTSLIIAEATTYPSNAEYAALIVRCDDSIDSVEVYFNADKYLGSDDIYDVVFRIDGGTPVPGQWSASTDSLAAFAPYYMVPLVIRMLLDSQELVFRISAYSTDYTYVVPIGGMREAMQALGCYPGTL